MKPTRLQVDIKPNHQPAVKQLMQMLGNVSSADAIGFLIETQMSSALARLHPNFNLPQFATEKAQSVTRFPNLQQEAPQDDTHCRQTASVSHGMPQVASHAVQRADHSLPQNAAVDALDALLGA